MSVYIIFFIILCGVISPIVVFVVTTKKYKHLGGKWYLEKKKNIVGQWTNPIRSLITFFQNNCKKTSGTGSLFTALSKLERSVTYKTETHILKLLEKTEKRGKIEIIEVRKEKTRFVWEHLFTKEIINLLCEVIRISFLKLRDKNAKPNPTFYKQFYTITFQKL